MCSVYTSCDFFQNILFPVNRTNLMYEGKNRTPGNKGSFAGASDVLSPESLSLLGR